MPMGQEFLIVIRIPIRRIADRRWEDIVKPYDMR